MTNQEIFQRVLDDLVRKHNLAVEGLTEQQLAEAIRQAIACGDFQRYVRASDQAQAVVYLPYQREQELEARIKQLEQEVAETNDHAERLDSCHKYRED